VEMLARCWNPAQRPNDRTSRNSW